MPAVPFPTLPDSARVWVFASPQPILGTDADELLGVTDGFVRSWAAHGALVVGSADWCYDHFLLVAADEAATGVTGCSIDSLFHTLLDLERSLGVTLLDNSPVWYRAEGEQIRAVGRGEFRELVARGEVSDDTIVFDHTVGTVGEIRAGAWERPFAGSWHERAFGSARNADR